MSRKPKVSIERVNAGRFLVDCEGCGTVGVWEWRPLAAEAKRDHVCGQRTQVPGAWGPRDRAAPLMAVTDTRRQG